jgi:hypothetical protein
MRLMSRFSLLEMYRSQNLTAIASVGRGIPKFQVLPEYLPAKTARVHYLSDLARCT